MEGIIGGQSLVKVGVKYKCQGYQLFQEQYVKKAFAKNNVFQEQSIFQLNAVL